MSANPSRPLGLVADLAPRRADALYSLGQLALPSGRPDEATSARRRFLEGGDDAAHKEQVQEMLDAIAENAPPVMAP